uniref:Reverse transcriptase domain-containing protein n=1 Tax=Fagus sylvatica TaxID=28930 RepID=A0A2N9HCB2_FAGSY
MTRQNKELWNAIPKGPPTPHDDNQPLPARENKSDDQEADSRQVTRRKNDEVQKAPSPNRHGEESACSSTHPSRDKTARPEEELHEMKKQMGDMKNSLKAKAARNLDNLVHRADSSFIPRITNFPLPSRFKVPPLENFDGTKDPFDYLEAFKTIMQLQAVPKEIMCRAFPMGLRGSARVWFNKLESESIGSFVQLSRAFIDHFIGSQRRGRPPTHLLSVKQMEGESLRAYVHRFNEEAMKIDCSKEDVTLTAFMAGLQKGDFLYDLCKDPPKTLSKLMYKAQKHMNAEDALESIDDPPPKRRKDIEDRKQEPTKQKVLKFSETPKRKRTTTPSVHNIMVVQRPTKNVRLDDQVISFSEEDARGTHQPHDDALVVTINIAGFTIRRVMIDNGSSTDILYLPTYQQMKLDKYKLRPMDAPLVGFTGDRVCPVDIITLPITVDTYPKTVSKTIDFLVVNCPSAYNAIIGRPTLNRLRAVMLFGLKNAGATYQRLMNRMFHDQIGRNVEVYVDDILVKSKEEGNHLDDLGETFETLRKYQMKLNPSKCAFGVYSGKFLGFMVSQRGIEANPDKIKAILEMQPPRTTKEIQRLTGRVAALNRFVPRSTDKCLPFFKTLKKAFVWTDECQQAFEELKTYLMTPPLLSPSKQGEELYLYLAVSPTAISSALVREENRWQLPVYYTSRALREVEERYPPMEKLAFALVIMARKLRPYFQAHTIIVLTNHPLRKAMNKPDAAGRLIQWSVELSEFDIDYRPRTAIKAQAPANFVAEFISKEDEPTDKEED